MDTAYILVAVTVVLGSLLQANMGLGMGLLNMLVFPLLFPFPTAIALNLIIATAPAIYLMIRYWHDIPWKTLAPVTAISVAISTIATVYSVNVQQNILKAILGLVLVLLSLYSLFAADRIRVRTGLKSGLLMGAVAGVGNGLFSIGGPTVALYLMASLQKSRTYIAAIQTYFFFSNVFAFATRTSMGALQAEHIPVIVAGCVCAAAGTWLGVKISGRLPEQLTKRLVYGIIGCSGVVSMIQAFSGI